MLPWEPYGKLGSQQSVGNKPLLLFGRLKNCVISAVSEKGSFAGNFCRKKNLFWFRISGNAAHLKLSKFLAKMRLNSEGHSNCARKFLEIFRQSTANGIVLTFAWYFLRASRQISSQLMTLWGHSFEYFFSYFGQTTIKPAKAEEEKFSGLPKTLFAYKNLCPS